MQLFGQYRFFHHMERYRADQVAERYQKDVYDTLYRIQRIGGWRGKIEHVRYAVLKAAQDERGYTCEHQNVLGKRLFVLIAPEIIHRDIDENTA